MIALVVCEEIRMKVLVRRAHENEVFFKLRLYFNSMLRNFKNPRAQVMQRDVSILMGALIMQGVFVSLIYIFAYLYLYIY